MVRKNRLEQALKLKRPLRVKDIIGLFEDPAENGEELQERVRAIREQIGKDMEKRIADIRARLQDQ